MQLSIIERKQNIRKEDKNEYKIYFRLIFKK